MALIPPFFLDTVVAIGVPIENEQKAWIGTGFLFGNYNMTQPDGQKNYEVFLITNKHVLKDQRTIILRFNPQTDQAAKDYIETIIDTDGNPIWTGHSNPNYDVAVMRLNGQILQNEGMKFALFASDQAVMTSDKMKENQISEGDFCYVLGFPMGLVSPDRQYVILRKGVIARIRDFFEKRSTDFVVDAFVFPGNSGGPVILKPEMISITGTKANQNAALIGIIKSYITFQDVAYSKQTNKPRIIFEENSGLALVEPVDHIIETIAEDKAKLAKKELEKANAAAKVVADKPNS